MGASSVNGPSGSNHALPPPPVGVAIQPHALPRNPKLCFSCGNPNPPALCGRCRLVSFCGKICQKASWKAHKAACKDPLVKNEKRWTPLHEDAINGKSKESLSQALQADWETLKDQYGGTPSQLQKLQVMPDMDDPKPVVEIEQADKSLRPVTRKELHELMGWGCYFDGYIASRETLLNRDRLTQPGRLGIPGDHPNVVQFKLHPPKIVLYKDEQMGWGVRVRQVKTGSIIMKLGGEYTLLPPRDPKKANIYNFVGLDSSYIFGPGIMANDNPVNAMIAHIGNDEGLPAQAVLIALIDIEDEPIYIDYYGKHDFKLQHYAFDNRAYQRAVDLCKGENLAAIFLKTIAKTATTYEQLMFKYIWNTPNILFKLLLEKKLHLGQADLLLQNIEVIGRESFFGGEDYVPLLFPLYKDAMKAIEKIHALESSGDKDIVRLVNNLPNKITAFTYSKVLYLILNDPHFSSANFYKHQAFGEIIDHLKILDVRAVPIIDEEYLRREFRKLLPEPGKPFIGEAELLKFLTSFQQTAYQEGQLERAAALRKALNFIKRLQAEEEKG